MKLLETFRGYSARRKFFFTIVLLIVLDRSFVWLGNEMLMKNDVDFEARWERANIDLSTLARGDKTICEFEYVLLIYGYQTCFDPMTSPDDIEKWGYYFTYSKPKPKLAIFFRGDTPDNYYFEIIFADSVKFIRVDGVTFNNNGEPVYNILSRNDGN